MASANPVLYLLFVLVGLLAGWVAADFTKSAAYGRTVDLIAGALASLGGGSLFLKLAIQTTGWFWPLITALVSAMLVLGALRAVKNIASR